MTTQLMATVTMDCDGTSVRFDVSRMLAGVDADFIAQCEADEWRNSKTMDCLALHSSDKDVSALFADMACLRRHGVENCGYEVEIDPEEARAWVTAHRPDAAALLQTAGNRYAKGAATA